MRINLTCLILLLAFLQVTLAANAQKISLSKKNASLTEIFKELRKQSGYDFLINKDQIKISKPVTIQVNGNDLTDVLNKCFEGQPFTYKIEDKTIIVINKREQQTKVDMLPMDVKGRVVDENGKALVGASISIKGASRSTSSGSDGSFSLRNVADDATIAISYIGYKTKEIKIAVDLGTIVMEMANSQLDAVQVIAYGTTTRRLNTGSVISVSSKDIERQPVSNPLASLMGKVPGLVVTQQSGTPGSSFNIQIRGRNSIVQGSQPLILIDGIPFAAGNNNIGLFTSSLTNTNQNSGVSPFNGINPSDIESIEVLKDADATAIYGSRGANGVILIVTKKGQAGKTQISANVNQGFTKLSSQLDLLNTSQYIAMRQEAFKNSGTTPSNTTAPDLLIYDKNRYTDYQKEFLGGAGSTTNANLSLSGGNGSTLFLLSGTYYRETNIFPGNLPNQRASVLANISHRSADDRLNVNFSGNFTSVENRAPSIDLTNYTFLPPNTPSFFDANGQLKWSEGGIVYDNPYGYLKEKYSLRTNNLTSSLNTSYKIFEGLSIKALLGYNQQFTNEQLLSPSEAKRPNVTILGPTANFGRNQYSSWNVEPQMEYSSNVWKGKLTALVGGTFHAMNNNSLSVEGSGYSSNALMEDFGAASIIDASSVRSMYKYNAIFGRLNYNISDKYLLNLTARRDGSSRFGPGKQFSNFGAIGAAWIFSSEKWIGENIPVLSFGKLRASYGVTGNDQIGDYRFVSTWSPYVTTYGGISTLVPDNLFNGDYAWERNNKFEAALDLGFFKDRLLFSVNYFQNRSGNQLINYKLPSITGFSSILANFPAKVENKGWEFIISGSVIKTGRFKWDSNFNFTLPSNRLLEFPDIETSTYNAAYKVGQSLNIINAYVSQGVDPQTGLIRLLDANGSNSLTNADYQTIGKTDPTIYGGWQNMISFAGLEFQWFFDFKKQFGRNANYSFYPTSPPGTLRNQPSFVLDRWQNIGDVTGIPKFVASAAGTITANNSASSYMYGDQSFIKLRNISLAYSLPGSALSKIKAKTAKIYLQAQNVLTFSNMKGYDPEVQSAYVLSPLTACTIGVQITY